jgi:hypothetical protein
LTRKLAGASRPKAVLKRAGRSGQPYEQITPDRSPRDDPTSQPREQRRGVDLTLKLLRAERTKIDQAIAALEELRTRIVT